MKRFLLIMLLTGVLAAASYAAVRLTGVGMIEDIAGVPGKSAYGGDNADALEARLANPLGLAIDRWNNLYIADTRNHRVRRVDVRSGEIETIAGTGRAGFAGDGGSADDADLNAPTALAIDSIGNIYVADTGNQRIRLIDRKGNIYTIAGTGRRGYEGEGTKAKNTTLNNPTGVAVNSKGFVFVADTGNHRIRMIEPTTGKLVTVVGNGEALDDGDWGLAVNASLNRPTAIIFDKHDNLFIADTGNHKIRFVDSKTGRILTLTGTGEAGYSGDNSGRPSDAQFNEPTGLALDRLGRLYIADTNNNRIRRITIDLTNQVGYVETVVGTGKRGYNGSDIDAWDAQVAYPGFMVINPYDMMYFLDTGNNLLRRVQGISVLRPPTSSTSYLQPVKETDSRSFYDVLFSINTDKNAKKK